MHLEAYSFHSAGQNGVLGHSDDPLFDSNDVALLQACVGFHAKAQSDPFIRDRLYRLWCKLDELKRAA